MCVNIIFHFRNKNELLKMSLNVLFFLSKYFKSNTNKSKMLSTQ